VWPISDWKGKLWTGNSKHWQFWLHVCIFTFSILQVLEGSGNMYTDQEIRMRFSHDFPFTVLSQLHRLYRIKLDSTKHHSGSTA
jgi:hypothetical protein